MILRKIKNVINEFRAKNENLSLQNEVIKSQLTELEWAHIFHDTIKDRSWLKNLAISPGRWAVNYSFFYILVRILSDYKPEKIIEFGLGESSKIVSTFLNNELPCSSQLIIEHDQNWIAAFKPRFNLSPNSDIIHLALEQKMVNNFPVESYSGIADKINEIFDLYIIDGPFGSDHFSRYDVCLLVEKVKRNDEFIIIIDDYNRVGEKETAHDLINQLTAKGIKSYTGIYNGNKSQIILATEKYRFATSL